MNAVLRLTALLALTSSALSFAQEAEPLAADQQTNGARTLDAVSLIQGTTRPSIVQIVDEKGETAQLGVVVSHDGYVVTKASEVPGFDLVFAWSDGTQSAAAVVLVDRGLDLLLAKADRTDTVPITPASSIDCERGEWVVAFTKPMLRAMALRLGNISASRRRIEGHGAALGIRMSNTATEGVRVVSVASESPAAAAGIKNDDVVIALDDQPVIDSSSLSLVMGTMQPGEQVKLRIRRGPEEHDCSVRLASRSKVVSNWDGEDYANGGVSLRTDSFPDVLQHQIPLTPHDMGGPLINLDGRTIGLNIARVDRVSTFALPIETFWNKVQQWIIADRKASANPGVPEIRPAEPPETTK